MLEVVTKKCAVCSTEKPVFDFYKSARRECKDCTKARIKANKENRTPEQLDRDRLYRKNYKTYLRRKLGKPTREEFLRTRNEKKKQTALSAAEKRAEQKLIQSNKPKLSSAEAYRLRYKTDPAFKAKERMRRYLRKSSKKYQWVSDQLATSAKRKGARSKIWQLLGYSADDLVAHLQRQLTGKMTMKDFMNGKIHIDHIVPQKAFDLNNLDELRACHALTNLRPMWAKDNIKKSAKRLFLL